MITEEMRSLKIFYLLSQTENYMKASDLAQQLQISERTVKNDIEKIKECASDRGCTLKSVRGKGYILSVDNEIKFHQEKEKLEILFNNVEKENMENSVYSVSRAILIKKETDSEGYFRIETLAEFLCFSSSDIKKKMPEVRNFLERFHLSLQSKPGRGLKLSGSEMSNRICMMELYENHFRKRVIAFRDDSFEQCFADRGDKDQIRKTMLEVIRSSEHYLYDAYINRLVDYLLLMRNRCCSGRRIKKEKEYWYSYQSDLRNSREYDMVKKLFDALRKYDDFIDDEDEMLTVTVLIQIWEDWDVEQEVSQRFPEVYATAEKLAQMIMERIAGKWNLHFLKAKGAECIHSGLTYILLQIRYGCNQYKLIGNSVSENEIKESVLAMALADEIAEVIREQYHTKMNEYTIQLLAVKMYGLIKENSYPYNPRRILVCARNGTESAKIIEESVKRRFGTEWIGKIQVDELYEARKYPLEEWDSMIGSFQPYSYRYAWKYTFVHLILQPEDYERIRKEVILPGYDIERVVQECGWDVVRVHHDFPGKQIESLLQLLAYQWGDNLAAKEALARMFTEQEKFRIHSGILTIFVPTYYTNKQIFELYILKKNIMYGRRNVKAISFVSVDFHNDPAQLRFVEHAMRWTTKMFDEIKDDLNSETIMDKLTEIVRKEL